MTIQFPYPFNNIKYVNEFFTPAPDSVINIDMPHGQMKWNFSLANRKRISYHAARPGRRWKK